MIWLNFVGEGRSGHTVLSGAFGSRLDARITEEQKYISHWRRGESREQILSNLLKDTSGRPRREQGWPNLDTYREPLHLIGDKCGWDAVNEYKKRQAPVTIISDFEQFIGMPVKTIVTVRNPLDNIASWFLSAKYQRLYPEDSFRYTRLIRRYRRFYKAAVEILEGTDYKIVCNEELIANPSHVLQEIATWLELPYNRPWRRASAKRIFKEPHRYNHPWPEEQLEKIRYIVDNVPLLEYYRNGF